MKQFDFTTYISPSTWRYGSIEMRGVWSEQHKYELWRKTWVAIARAQSAAGLVSKAELTDLIKNEKAIDIARIHKIEEETKHDVVAAIKEFAEKAKKGGGKIHWGATSMDIVDNTDSMRVKESLGLIEKKLHDVITSFAEKTQKYAGVACMGYTHLQPAEPTTVGYRLAFYLHELLLNKEILQNINKIIKAKGMKGAVGTSASYEALLKGSKLTVEQFEKKVMSELGIENVPVSTQVSTRQYDYMVLTALAGIAGACAKFAGDVRLLQAPSNGEWSEAFAAKQVGSSAMPFKKNPINAEKVCSLARLIFQLPTVALENASLSYLERTLDDSANRRYILPEAFLLLDEILLTSLKLIKGLVINETAIKRNLDTYAPFAATESLIIASVKNGANRQEMHELLRSIAMKAWSEVQMGSPNPMVSLLEQDTKLSRYVNKKTIQSLLEVSNHVGQAEKRARFLARQVLTNKK